MWTIDNMNSLVSKKKKGYPLKVYENALLKIWDKNVYKIEESSSVICY